MLLSDKVFDTEVFRKLGMSDLADAVQSQSWTHLFVGFVPYLDQYQVRDFYYNGMIGDDSSLTTKVDEKSWYGLRRF